VVGDFDPKRLSGLAGAVHGVGRDMDPGPTELYAEEELYDEDVSEDADQVDAEIIYPTLAIDPAGNKRENGLEGIQNSCRITQDYRFTSFFNSLDQRRGLSE
jgi:hypothetical protein